MPISMRIVVPNNLVDTKRKDAEIHQANGVDIAFIQKMPRFGISPFVVNMTHRDAELEFVFEIQKAAIEITDGERSM